MLELIAVVALIGAGATAVTDLWVVVRKRLFGVPAPDYGLLGRWIAYLFRGRFHHDAIARTPAVRGERLIGWGAHYLIGIVFAATLLGIWGLEWARHPTMHAVFGLGLYAAACMLSAISHW